MVWAYVEAGCDVCGEKNINDGAASQKRKAKRRYMDAVRENMQLAGVTEDDVQKKLMWRRVISYEKD